MRIIDDFRRLQKAYYDMLDSFQYDGYHLALKNGHVIYSNSLRWNR